MPLNSSLHPSPALNARMPEGVLVAHRASLAGACFLLFAIEAVAAPIGGTSQATFGLMMNHDGDIFLVGALAIASLVAWLVLCNVRLRRERHHVEERLARAEARAEGLFEAVPGLVWLKDMDGRYIACNGEFARYVSRPKAEILGKTDFDLVPGQDAETYRRSDLEALQRRTSYTEDLWVPTPLGGRVLLRTTKTPATTYSGEVTGVWGVARDITEWHETSRAMAELQDRFDAAFRNSPVAACISRFSTGEVLKVNEKFVSEFGWPSEVLVGRKFKQLPLWSDAADYEEWKTALAKNPLQQTCQARWQDRRTGTVRWVNISAALTQHEGELCLLTHAIDFTAQHQAETLLEGQRTILQGIAKGAALTETLEALTKMVENVSPGMRASVLLIDRARRLRHGAAPNLPREFMDAIDGREIGPDVGTCGAAAFHRRTVISEDIANDAAWLPVRDLALRHGLRACWSTPILERNGDPVGTFALYYDRPASPDELQLRIISIAARTAEIAIVRQHDDETLRNAESLNKLLFTDSTVPHVVLDPDTGAMVDGNEAAARYFAVASRKDLVGMAAADVMAEYQAEDVTGAAATKAAIFACLEHGEFITRWRNRLPDGTERYSEARLARFIMGERTLIQMALRDISEQTKVEESLRLAATVFENTDEGIVITDRGGTILAVNPAFSTITGYTAEETVGKNPRILQSGYHDAAFYQSMWESLLARGRWQGEIWNRHKDLHIFPEWLTVSAVKNAQDEITHYVAVFSDISVIKQAQEALAFQANHDPLTNLPNRKLLRQRIELALQRAERQKRQVALLFIDLDRFKNVNDTLGHSVGDSLLVEAARRMVQAVRPSDTLARWGGDEFVLVVEEDTTIANVTHIAEGLLNIFRQPLPAEIHEIDITASIGVSLYPDSAADLDTLLSQADMAMYQAKEEGRNGLQFYETKFGMGVEERMKLEVALRRVVQRGELVLQYQPQMSLQSGQLTGVEALVRWQHPEYGVISPARFIPIAEDVGAINQIGEWVLEEACRQFAAWRESGVPIPRIAVNLSAHQIERTPLLATVRRLLGTYKVLPWELELEVTESSIMRKVETVTRILDGLHQLGVQLSVDDFGTGYSSLSYLKRLPVHRLKIDRSFVKDIGVDASDESLVKAIAALGHSLGLELIAEGVEREDQISFLRQTGCEVAQGFLFAKPMSGDELAAFAAARASSHTAHAVS